MKQNKLKCIISIHVKPNCLNRNLGNIWERYFLQETIFIGTIKIKHTIIYELLKRYLFTKLLTISILMKFVINITYRLNKMCSKWK